jgi:hypothetical protein
MDPTDAFEETSEPLHLQQLQLMAASLLEAQQRSDSMTWMPETIPTFVQQAIKGALAATAEGALLLAPQLLCFKSTLLAGRCLMHRSALYKGSYS